MKSQIFQLTACVLVLSAMSASATIRYVNVNSASPASPCTDWATAATTILAAVDAAVVGDQILVTNGVYQTGGITGNRVAVAKPLMVRSVNGAAVTVIQGQGTARCVSLSDGAALTGFTLTSGFAEEGGGVWCASAAASVHSLQLTTQHQGREVATVNKNPEQKRRGNARKGKLPTGPCPPKTEETLPAWVEMRPRGWWRFTN